MRMAIFLFCIWAAGWARSGDEFLGFWFSEGRNSVIEIFEENETYEARIVRLKYPLYPEGHVYADREIMDLENPDPDLQPRTLAGITFAWGFVFDAKSARWVDGRIYNPETGKTYFAFMEMKTPNSLRIKGSLDYHGWFGKSTFWQRADADSLLWFEKAKPAGMVVPAITGEMRDSSVEDMDSLFRK